VFPQFHFPVLADKHQALAGVHRHRKVII
jgi:hypothetical protein